MWAHASEATLSRAARCPMVLLDFNFQRAAWWSRVIGGQASVEPRIESSMGFHAHETMPLARELLIEAWSAARSRSSILSLVFGMTPEVSRLMTELSPAELERVVASDIQALKPRWENRRGFWKELLRAASDSDDQTLANVNLHCLQLLGGDLHSTLGTSQVLDRAAKGAAQEATLQDSCRRSPIPTMLV
jgi:hypothetical protein